MEASRQQLLGPITARPPAAPEREPGSRMVARVARRATLALLLANGAGAIVTFALGAWVVPPPHGLDPSANLDTNIIGFVVALVVGGALGTYLSIRASRDTQRWLREDRAPTPNE